MDFNKIDWVVIYLVIGIVWVGNVFDVYFIGFIIFG